MNINFGPFPSESWKATAMGCCSDAVRGWSHHSWPNATCPNGRSQPAFTWSFYRFCRGSSCFFSKPKLLCCMSGLQVISGGWNVMKSHGQIFMKFIHLYPDIFKIDVEVTNETHVISVGKGGKISKPLMLRLVGKKERMKHVAISEDESTMVNWWCWGPPVVWDSRDTPLSNHPFHFWGS